MKRHRLLLIVIAALLVLGLFYAIQPSKTPSPQPPLVTLNATNFSASFYGALNGDAKDARLVLLVSPT
ncbi:MAG TPA: hypothetical protein VJN90_06630 [Candidatus Acidoferrales bacterium]|nr:hypothetical protein [Candidatus Acidoferrales bacterium]